MLCPRCHTEMQVVRYAPHSGKDGRTVETEHRCVKCWYHETERRPRDFKIKKRANL